MDVCQAVPSQALVADTVRLMSTTEGRTKAYRLIQYGSKATQLILKRIFDVDANSSESIRLLKKLELLMGTCRKAIRLFRFLDMWILLPTVTDKNIYIRRLRQMRVLSFLGMFLFENISLFYPTTDVAVHGGKEKKRKKYFTIQWSRLCHACWLASLCLGVCLDYTLQRNSKIGMLKNLTELPIATILTLRVRVDDWLMCGLGLTSSVLGLHTQWTVPKVPSTHAPKIFESAH